MQRLWTGSVRRLAAVAASLGLALSPAATMAQRAERAPTIADAGVSNGLNDNSVAMKELLQDLQQMHLTVCAAKVSQAMGFIFDGQEARFEAEPFGQDSDRWPAVFIIESAAPNGGHTRLSTLMISPGCAGMYEQVIYWPSPCDVVHQTVFPKFTGEHVMLREVKVSNNGPALELFLTPAGSGCVSVKKELFR